MNHEPDSIRNDGELGEPDIIAPQGVDPSIHDMERKMDRRELLGVVGLLVAALGSLGTMIKLSEPENHRENSIFLECKKRKDEVEKYIKDFFSKYDVDPQNFPAQELEKLVNLDHECLAAYQVVKFKVEEFWKYIQEVANKKDLPNGLMNVVGEENDALFTKTKVPVPYGQMYTTYLDREFMGLRYKYFQAYDAFPEKIDLNNLEETLKAKGTTLLYVTTDADCGSCMDSAKSMAVIAGQYGKDVKVKKAVVPHGSRANLAPLIVNNLEIEVFPTLILLVDGKIIGILEGGFTNPNIVKTFAKEAGFAQKNGEVPHKSFGNIPGMPTIGLYD